MVEGKKGGKPEVFLIENVIQAGIIQIRAPSDSQYVQYLRGNPRIHEGDADVLALALELGGIALLDDDAARGMAEVEGIEHHGTIYLLLRMMKMRLLTKEETLQGLDEMIRRGWRCSTELYASILKAMG